MMVLATIIQINFKQGGLKMRRRDAGLILLSVGVLCGIIYILLKLSGDSSASTQTTNLLMYSGIVAIVAGLIVFGTSRAKSLL